MKIVITIFYLIVTFISTPAQKNARIDLPKPNIGWQILTSKLVYPEMARLAGLDITYIVSLTVDSDGKIKDINIPNSKFSGNDYLFIPMISKALTNVEWHSGNIDGVPTSMRISFKLSFTQSTLVESGHKGVISIDSSTRILIDSLKQSK